MKGSLLVLFVFILGGLIGLSGWLPQDIIGPDTSITILYILILQVGLSLGSSKNLSEIIKSLNFKVLAIPAATITGTLLFTALASLLLTQWNAYDCMAVGSGFAYYSLSSVLITELKGANAGVQIATELGTIALLANIIREMIGLLGAPAFTRYFGRLAPISVAGINSMDVCLPVISKYSGSSVIPMAIIHGIVLEMCVPLLISIFCQFT